MQRARSIFLAATAVGGLIVSLSGCVPLGAGADATTQPTAATTAQAAASTDAQAAVDVQPPQDAQETARRFFRVEVHEINAPAGAISASKDFWKPADETFLGFNLHEALDRSGVRVGRAKLVDVAPTLAQFDDVEMTNQNIMGVGGKIEVETSGELSSQTIFWYDPRREFLLDGRDYGRSQNLYVIAYRQLARRPDHVQVEFAPAVRELRPMLRVNESGVSWKPPDTIYALGISCELSPDECVIISPSPIAAENKLVLGRAFLMGEGVAQPMERVLVIIPRVMHLIDQPQAGSAEAR